MVGKKAFGIFIETPAFGIAPDAGEKAGHSFILLKLALYI
jgi:hypothetical protein